MSKVPSELGITRGALMDKGMFCIYPAVFLSGGTTQ